MAVSEAELQAIVSAVVAQVKTGEDIPKAQLGIFNDMNTAIAAAKDAQKIMQRMPMDMREKIISKIRELTRENAAEIKKEEINYG